MKPGISFVIQEPSADLDTPEYEGNKMYIRGVVHSMDNLTPSNIFPARVLEYVSKVFDDDNYRAEILEGRTMFKFYRKPSRDLVPQEEDGTLLEKHIGTMGLGSGPGNYAVDRNEEAKKYDLNLGGAGSSPVILPEIISGQVLGEERSVQCLTTCDSPSLCLSRKKCDQIIDPR